MKVILYVEDNADHAELVLRHLEHFHVRDQVEHVTDGDAALAYLDAVVQGVRPPLRLVLLDLRLPRVDGIDVLRHIKDTPALREVPVVVFTTSSAERDIRAAYASYANSYLVKPDDLRDLRAVLGELSHYWLAQNRLSAP